MNRRDDNDIWPYDESAKSLHTEDACLLHLTVQSITQNTNVDFKALWTKYPNNDWGAMLMFYDEHVRLFKGRKMQTRIEKLRPNKNDSEQNLVFFGIEEWLKRTDGEPSIPYISAVAESIQHALSWFQNPPPDLRKYLVRLSKGEALKTDSLFEFVNMYACFYSRMDMLYASVEDLRHENADKRLSDLKNRDAQISEQMQWFCNYVGRKLETARSEIPRGDLQKARKNAVYDIKEQITPIIKGEKSPPNGFDKSWYEKMIYSKDEIQSLKNRKKDKALNDYHFPLKQTYFTKNLSNKELIEIYKTLTVDSDRLPPII